MIFNASYTSEAAAFYTWRMMDPSEHVELSISYPTSLKMQFKPFLLEPQPTTTIDDPGFFQVVFDSWIMPRSGFAWKLLAPFIVRTTRRDMAAALAQLKVVLEEHRGDSGPAAA